MEKEKKPIFKKWWFWAIIVIIIIAIASQGALNQNNTTATNTGEKVITKIGETLTAKNFKVTVEEIQKPKGNDYNKPADGNEFVQVILNIENISNEEYNISSLLMFKAYYDGYSVNESLSAQIENDKIKTMDGTLAAGKKIRGKLSYELPKGWKQLEIDVDLTELTFSDDGKIKIKLENV